MTGARLAAALVLWAVSAAAVAADRAPREPPGTTAGAPAIELRIEAPDPLDKLLARHLDLARLAALRGQRALDLQRLIAASPAQVRELLSTEGYFEPKVELEREDGTPPRVRLKVEPGPRVHVVNLDLTVQGDLQRRVAAQDAEARKLVAALRVAGPLREGAVFRNAHWSDTKQEWLTRLRVAGYAAATLSASEVEVEVASAGARIRATLDSGPLFHAGELKVEGLARHEPSTVRDLAASIAGRPLTESLLTDFQNRLVKAGLYSTVAISFDTRPEAAAASTVTVRLGEQSLQQATVGIGFSTDTGPRVSFEHIHRRLLGRPLVAHNKIEWGTVTQRWNGDFLTHPGVDFDRWMFGVQVEREISDTDEVLSQRVRFGRTQDTPRLERLLFAEALRSRQRLDSGDSIDAQSVSGNLHLLFRHIDQLLSPTDGFTLSLQLAGGAARSNSGENGPFARLYGRLTGFLPLPSGWHAQGRLELGQIVKRDEVVVPDALGFRAGGDESVRGYEYRSLAPTVGGDVVSGNVLFTASGELAHPILATMPELLGAVFLDAGRAANRWQDLEPALGYGFGVRWRSPVGPLRADIAWADETKEWRVHFAVGVVF